MAIEGERSSSIDTTKVPEITLSLIENEKYLRDLLSTEAGRQAVLAFALGREAAGYGVSHPSTHPHLSHDLPFSA